MSTPGKEKEKPIVGITLGDPNGVGPEVVLKTLNDDRINHWMTPVIFASGRALSFYKKLLNIEPLPFSQVRNKGQFQPGQLNVVNVWDEGAEIKPGEPSQEAGRMAYAALKEATEHLRDGKIEALVTGPIDKNSIQGEDFPFKGHTDYLASYFDVRDWLMLMVSDGLRVGLVTDHVSFKDVPSVLTRELVESKLSVLDQSLRNDFGISKPKIAILGLNPHAGESGLLGKEEQEILTPLLNEWKNKGKLVFGPFPADGFFGSGNYRRYDGILAMYHDQGLIPFKALAFSEGVNYTAGLPVIRTSPDHGTGYAIAGKNTADESSLRSALFLAYDLAKRKKE